MNTLEKRIADLEMELQSRPTEECVRLIVLEEIQNLAIALDKSKATDGTL